MSDTLSGFLAGGLLLTTLLIPAFSWLIPPLSYESQRLGQLLLLALLVVLLIALVYLIALYRLQGGGNGHEPMHGFINPRFFNQYQGWLLPVLTGLLLLPRPAWLSAPTWWGLLLLSLGLHWALIWQTQGRGLLVALVLGRPGRRFALATPGVAVLALMVLAAYVTESREHVEHTYEKGRGQQGLGETLRLAPRFWSDGRLSAQPVATLARE